MYSWNHRRRQFRRRSTLLDSNRNFCPSKSLVCAFRKSEILYSLSVRVRFCSRSQINWRCRLPKRLHHIMIGSYRAELVSKLLPCYVAFHVGSSSSQIASFQNCNIEEDARQLFNRMRVRKFRCHQNAEIR